MFAVIERYMKQKPDEILDVETNEEQKKFWIELNEIWDWWNDRDDRQNQLDEAMKLCSARRNQNYFDKYKEYNELEEKFEKEEDEMLERVLKIRRGLWI
jgi:hypothetical protein